LRQLIAITLFSLSIMSCADQTMTPHDNHPFIGCWENETGLDREGWTIDPSGWLIGYAASRDGAGNITFFEHMRIERSDKQDVLVVTGQDNSEARFTRRDKHNSQEFWFENPAHDYPQIIVYKRKGDDLQAYIALMDGTKKVTFNKRACKVSK